MIMKQDNPQTLLPEAWRSRFHRFLVEKRLVSDEKAKYFVGWVERFLETANGEAARFPPEPVSAFLDELSRQDEPANVGQAAEAIRRR